MGMRLALLVVLVAAAAVAAAGYKEDERERWEGEGEGGGREGRKGGEWFLLQESKQVVRTDAGEMRVVRGGRGGGRAALGWGAAPPMHIGFITMEPRSLFIPQYLDSTLILFIRTGEAKVGHIYKDELVEKTLRIGDIYRIESGSAFYLVNTGEGQRLHVICSIDTSDSLGWHTFQAHTIIFLFIFLLSKITGGTNPASILSGFDHLTMSTAFNVSAAELGEMLTRQKNGPIVYLSDTHSPSMWTKFMHMEQHEKLKHMRKIIHVRAQDLVEDDEEQQTFMWSFKNLVLSMIGRVDKRKGDEKKHRATGKGPDAYNLYDRKPDFKNDYGWSIALDESDYEPLKYDDFGVYLVNLTAGSMMAPHINPRATEYGIVLSGSGTIQIVFPNGSLAMNAKVAQGEVFWIPRYFPFCQIASRTGPFEFFGFTTSARNNRPQFLAGANSLLQTMSGPEMAAAFGLSEERLNEIVNSQRETTILPSATVAPPDDLVYCQGFKREQDVTSATNQR
ncbi:RmlC-like cupins superfamily protein [Striga hermonthica]|uniref:RmlC-like cupins superfamily protein n=1 Tax=Striga hermonthica TaxID=68872 RepID=A0A9N7N505_STRHE|nr:RmlC-like cupins superfamily protein [Striga hermonthica]